MKLKVSAYDPQLHAISLVQDKTGKVKHVFLTDQEAALFGEQWAKSNQQPRMKAVLKAAGIKRHVRFHELRHTFVRLAVSLVAAVASPGSSLRI
ncbi:hypothetical protein [Tunturiibacter gelidoferens]|uniref:Integrase n=1 Tax=Tunturiibacter gelidiferens TaxID=3069689 RepID=A0A9X0U358_9BACT|nr:hypothetical protein [Edaphobacter lichenicola]MBB5327999.1 integrase [Edaphobacter lichenicola]